MYAYKGSCSCGHIQFVVRLPKTLLEYTLRACDCDYCSKRDLKYLSDPHGEILLNKSDQFKIELQGSMQARFCLCPKCGDTVCGVGDFSEGQKGAVNASLIDAVSEDHSCQSVSPAKLGPEEKRERWSNVWAKVIFTSNKIT